MAVARGCPALRSWIGGLKIYILICCMCIDVPVYVHVYTVCRLMRRRIKVADPRIFLIYAAYIHIREEVVDEYHYEHTAVRNIPGIRVVLDC